MKMIRYQRPSVNIHPAFFNNHSQTINKVDSILVVPKNLPPLYAPTHDMMQNPRGLPAIGCASGAGRRASNLANLGMPQPLS
jgi:hypothetical protein